MTQELMNLLRESFEYSMTNVHTSFPGNVVKYDAKTRRADVQPSLKRKLPDGSFADFPIIPDVPVVFPGSKHCTIHFPLENGDEVEVRVCERSTDVWRDTGGKGIEDPDPRRFNLQDCFATPGLQPVEFPETPEDGLSIIYKDYKTNVVDNKATMKFKSVTVETDGDEVKSAWGKHKMTGDIEITGDVAIKGDTTITGDTEIKGGKCTMNGSVAPGTGPFCAIPACLFTGAPHGGNIVTGT
jgi:hypothetical protein